MPLKVLEVSIIMVGLHMIVFPIDGGALGMYVEEQLYLSNADVIVQYNTSTVQSFDDWQGLAPSVESLTVTSQSCNDPKVKSLDFSKFSQLVYVMINDQCFRYVEKVVFSGMERLARITVGVSCFAENPYHGKLNKSRSLTIKNCPVLNELNISRYSFSDYYSFTLSHVLQLQSLLIGDGDSSNNFQYCPDFHLIDLIKLQSIDLGSGSFMNASSIRFESKSNNRVIYIDLPSLQTIRMGSDTCMGSEVERRKILRKLPNSLSMKSLKDEME